MSLIITPGSKIDVTAAVLKGDNAGNGVTTNLTANTSSLLFQNSTNGLVSSSTQNATSGTASRAGISVTSSSASGVFQATSTLYTPTGLFAGNDVSFSATGDRLIIGTDANTHPIQFSVDGGVTESARILTGLMVGTTTDPGAGKINVLTGYRIGNAAASGKILKGDGTNFIASTETYAAPGTSGNVLTSDGTNWTSAAATAGGTVTHTAGALTSNAVVLGAGSADTKVSTGIISDGASKLTLGLNTSTLGQVKMFGNTSGDATVQPTAIAGTATVVTLPNASSTLPIYTQQITYAGPSAARTITYPDASITVARTDAANTFTGVQTMTSPVFTTPVLGTPSSGTLTSCTGTADGLTAGDVTRNHAVYAGASPPTVDVGLFTISKTSIDLKNAGTTTIFTVPSGRTFLLTASFAVVTAVTSGGAGVETFKIQTSTGPITISPNTSSASGTPTVGKVYAQQITVAGSPFNTAPAADNVQIVVTACQAGSTAVTGTIYLQGFYTA